MIICLELSANNLHMVQLMPLPPIISCFIKIQNHSAFLVPAYSDRPGKEAVKLVLSLCDCADIFRRLVTLTPLLTFARHAYNRCLVCRRVMWLLILRRQSVMI